MLEPSPNEEDMIIEDGWSMDSWTLRTKLRRIPGPFGWTDVPMFEINIGLDRLTWKAQAQTHFKYKNTSILFYGSLNE